MTDTTTKELDDLWPDSPEARQRPCPTCHADVGEPCVRMNAESRRSGVEIKQRPCSVCRVPAGKPCVSTNVHRGEVRADHHYLRR